MALTFKDFKKSIGNQFDVMKTNPYSQYLEPFCILGNVYYVGDKRVSMHLIDSGDGLILIDTGFPGTDAMLVNSIWRLGFNPKDIKFILHTHGHIDHYGATNFFQQVYGVKTYLGEADAKLMKEYPETFEWNGRIELFCPDELLHDGYKLKLGNTEIKVVGSPGHSPGAMSFFFNVEAEGKQYWAGIPGGIGRNTLFKEAYEALHYPASTPNDFLESVDRIIDEPVTLWLGCHPTPFHNDALNKRRKMIENPQGPNPFVIGVDEWRSYLLKLRKSMEEIVDNGCI
jgi:metallo-beta-lactamase class B